MAKVNSFSAGKHRTTDAKKGSRGRGKPNSFTGGSETKARKVNSFSAGSGRARDAGKKY
jgi:hypothetical protein